MKLSISTPKVIRHFIICLLSGALLLSGCDGGSKMANSQSNTDMDKAVTLRDGINLSYTSSIPSFATKNSYTTLLLINDSPSTLNAVNFSVANPQVSVSSSTCQTVAAGHSCVVNLRIKAGAGEGGFILNASAQAASGITYTTEQAVNYSAASSTNKLNINQFNNQITVAPNRLFSVALPFNYNQGINSVVGSAAGLKDIISQRVLCSELDPEQCSLVVMARATSSTNLGLQLNQNQQTLFSTAVSVLAVSQGNLLSSSYNPVVYPADGTTPIIITLLNSGNQPITGITVPSGLNGAVTATGGCLTATLNQGKSCTLSINANTLGMNNSSVQLALNYNTTSAIGSGAAQALAKNLILTVSYYNSSAVAGLALTSSGNLNNLFAGSTTSITFTLSNSGQTAINNIQYNKPSTQNPAFSVSNDTCTGKSLGVGATPCSVTFTYAPQSAGAGNLVTLFTAQYNDPKYGTLSLTSNSLSIPYSANAAFNYFSRWKGSAGISVCSMSESGLVGAGSGSESSSCFLTGTNVFTTNAITKPMTVQTIMFDNGVESTFVIDNNNGFIYACVSDTNTGNLNCNTTTPYIQLNAGYQNPATMSTYGLHMYKQSYLNQSYLYIATQNFEGVDNAITICTISNRGDNLGCTQQEVLDANSKQVFQDPTDLLFMESYIFVLNYNNVTRCSVDTPSGTLIPYTCATETESTLTKYITTNSRTYSMVMTAVSGTAGTTNYVYISDAGNNTNGQIIGCQVNQSLHFNNCKVLLSSLTNLRGLTLVNVNNANYLYYTNNNSGSTGGTTTPLYSRKINPDGSLGPLINHPATFSNQAPDQMYQLKLHNSTSVQYSKLNQYSYTPGSTISAQLNLTSIDIVATSVTLSAPSGISFNSGSTASSSITLYLDAVESSGAINISVAPTTAPGFYTITGMSSNGVVVPSLTIQVFPGTTLTGQFPILGAGIGSSGYLSPGYHVQPTINFTRPLLPSSVNQANFSLQVASNGANYSTIAASQYSVSESNNQVTLNYNGFASGYQYQVVLNVESIIDQNGMALINTTNPIALNFTPNLKIFVTESTFQGNFATGLNDAQIDSLCNLDGNNPQDGSSYKALVATTNRWNPTNANGVGWGIIAGQSYYARDGLTMSVATAAPYPGFAPGYIPFSPTLQYSPSLHNPMAIPQFGVWTGFYSDFNYNEINNHTVYPNQSSCNNFTTNDGSGSYTANTSMYIFNSLNNWMSNGTANCSQKLPIYCVQQP